MLERLKGASKSFFFCGGGRGLQWTAPSQQPQQCFMKPLFNVLFFFFFKWGDTTHMLACLECAQVAPKIALQSFALRFCDASESYSCEPREPQRPFDKHILDSSNLTVSTQFLTCCWQQQCWQVNLKKSGASAYFVPHTKTPNRVNNFSLSETSHCW